MKNIIPRFEFFTVYAKLAEMAILASKDLRTPKKKLHPEGLEFFHSLTFEFVPKSIVENSLMSIFISFSEFNYKMFVVIVKGLESLSTILLLGFSLNRTGFQ